MKEDLTLPGEARENFARLPQDKSFRDQFWYYALPYGLYIGGNALGSWLGDVFAAGLGGLAAALCLVYFARQGAYRLGPQPQPNQWLWTVLLGLVAAIVWIITYRLSAGIWAGGPHHIEAQKKTFTLGYLVARGLASTLVIPIAEELFIRVFALEAVHAHQELTKQKGPEWIWQKTLDEKPPALFVSPVTVSASLVAGLVFMLGHSFVAWPAAALWFAVTQLLYRITRNLKCAIAAHMLANGLITWAVIQGKMTWLW